jgi:DNA-binding transcriptional MerR regulator
VISGRGPIYTVEAVSDLLGIPRPTLYRYLREYSIPHLRRSGRISIPEESFERIREARDLHKEGLGTESVRRLLREGGSPNAGELKEQLDQLSENLEKIRGNEGPAADEALASRALRTVLARQNLLISAMFNLTEMVEELLLASGKPRKAVFDDVEGEIQRVTLPPETPEGVAAATEATAMEATATEASLKVLPARRARFGSLARRRRRGVLAVLSALLLGLLLTWALPTLGGELARGFPFSDAREAETSPGAPEARSENEVAAQNPPAGDEAQGAGSSGAEVAGRIEVPDVSDRGVVEAARTLSRAGFEVTAMKAVKSEQEAGRVMRTKPAAGSAMERGKPVIVVMSGGPTGIPPGLRGGGPASAATSQYTN